jgi:hypothetical protein
VVTPDPVFVLAVRYALALLFLGAAAGKLRHLSHFRTTLARYELLPVAAVAPVALAVPVVELALAAGLLLGGSDAALALRAAAALLAGYTLAIAVNLARGRRNIDCGCSGPALRQALSGWLLVRNAGLIGLALAASGTPPARQLGVADFVIVALAVAAAAVLYAAINQLTANVPRLTAMDAFMEQTR